MATQLTPYERYYQTTGLVEYEQVFEFNTELDTEVETYSRLLHAWSGISATQLRVLDIGCGLGTFTQKLLNALLVHSKAQGNARPPTFVVDLVDVNPGAFKEYAARLNRMERLDVQINKEICSAWQEVCRDDLASRYDLVIANHCFYGCICDPTLIRSVTDLLAPGGLALFALASRHSDIFQMRLDARISINSGEDLERALLRVNCNFSRAAYESNFYYDESAPLFVNWLFASSNLGSTEHDALLAKYSRQGEVRRFIVNRALVHIVEPESLPLSPE